MSFLFAAEDRAISIDVPFQELVLPWEDRCRFALRPKPQYTRPSLRPDWVNFGNSVLGSLYMAVDYDVHTMYVAKAPGNV